jgi:hypothetical protein
MRAGRSAHASRNSRDTANRKAVGARGAFARKPLKSGGEGEIRTHEPRKGPPVFKTGAFNRSATSPAGVGGDFTRQYMAPPGS